MRRPESAFTLLELLLVVALVGVVAAFAWPDFSGTRAEAALQESANRCQALVAMCRAEAMNEACRYRLEFRRDGTLRIRRQLDPLLAPHVYVAVDEPWTRTPPLLAGVWVESVQRLPDGPAPVYIVDENLEFPEMRIEPDAVGNLEADLALDFEPDGSCGSLRWILRDERGRARLLTLDGRLGSVRVEPWEAVPESEAVRPEPLEPEKEPEYDVRDFERR